MVGYWPGKYLNAKSSDDFEAKVEKDVCIKPICSENPNM